MEGDNSTSINTHNHNGSTNNNNNNIVIGIIVLHPAILWFIPDIR